MKKITLAGIVTGAAVKYSKKGNRFSIFRLEDRSGGVKCLCWAEAFNKYADLLKNDELLIVCAKVEAADGQEITIIVEEVRKLADAVPLKAQRLAVNLFKKDLDESYFESLTEIFNRNRGSCEVILDFPIECGISIKIQSQALRVQGTSRLENDLREMHCRVVWVL